MMRRWKYIFSQVRSVELSCTNELAQYRLVEATVAFSLGWLESRKPNLFGHRPILHEFSLNPINRKYRLLYGLSITNN